ncbi:MAG: prolipoprotein diacylglyceryl transferase [Bacteroidales bacterium]|nr:prolipoprotein diacylglyceryl transferase [Bacteroidales bacterium]
MEMLFVNWNVSPIIFSIGSFGVRWYSLLFALGFIAAYFILQKMFKKENVDIDILDRFTIYMFVSLLVGLRLGHCLFYEPDYYLAHPLEIVLPFDFETGRFVGYQGLASHGGAIGILIGIYLFYRKTKINWVWILDRLVIVIPLVGACVRVGNLMNSEIYGCQTSLPWGFIYLQNGEIVPKHPTQLYEALSYFLIFVSLMIYYFKTNGKPRPGKVFGIFLVALFGIRFLIEFIKEDQVGFEDGMFFNMGQLLSIPFILAGCVFLYLSNKHKFSDSVFLTKNGSKK